MVGGERGVVTVAVANLCAILKECIEWKAGVPILISDVKTTKS